MGDSLKELENAIAATRKANANDLFWGWSTLVTGLGYGLVYTVMYPPMAIGFVGMLTLALTLLLPAMKTARLLKLRTPLFIVGAIVASVPVWNVYYLWLIMNSIPLAIGILIAAFTVGALATKVARH